MWFVILIFLAFAIVTSAAWAGLLAAPWVPTWSKDFPRIQNLAALQADDTVFELGAGEGRVLRLFAQTPAKRIVGFELSLLPWCIAWLRTRTFAGRVEVLAKDFFRADFSFANVIFCFLTPPAMAKLKKKFATECKPGTRIVSYAFAIPGWEPELVDKPNEKAMAIYRYTIGPHTLTS